MIIFFLFLLNLLLCLNYSIALKNEFNLLKKKMLKLFSAMIIKSRVRSSETKGKKIKSEKKSDENEKSEKILQPKMNFFLLLLLFYFRSHTFSMTKKLNRNQISVIQHLDHIDLIRIKCLIHWSGVVCVWWLSKQKLKKLKNFV